MTDRRRPGSLPRRLVISGLEAFVETFRMVDDTVVVGSTGWTVRVRPGEVLPKSK